MKWIRWMQSPWLSRLIAALMSLSMGIPAVWAYGDQLRPFASTQQPAVPFQFTREVIESEFLSGHTLSRQVFEQHDVLLIDRRFFERDSDFRVDLGGPLFLRQYLTQVAADAKERRGVTLTLAEAAQETGIKLVWYDSKARSLEEAREGLKKTSEAIHNYSETQFAKSEVPNDDVVSFDPAWFAGRIVYGAPETLNAQLAAWTGGRPEPTSVYDQLSREDRIRVDSIHPSPEARRVIARFLFGELSKGEAVDQLVAQGTMRNLAEVYVQQAAKPKPTASLPSITVIAQRITGDDPGAQTGQTHIDAAIAAGATGALIGHSETRPGSPTAINDTPTVIQRQMRAAVERQEIRTIILAVGEQQEATDEPSLAARNKELRKQLASALGDIKEAQVQGRLIIAYEPRWAIVGSGQGRPATPQYAEEAHHQIRQELAALYTDEFAAQVRIIYGGGTSAENAASFLNQLDIDGLLAGGASTSTAKFLPIVEAAVNVAAEKSAKNGRTLYIAGNQKTYPVTEQPAEFAKALAGIDPALVQIGLAPTLTALRDWSRALSVSSSPHVRITIPKEWQQYTHGATEIVLPGRTLDEATPELLRRFPELAFYLQGQLLDADGRIKPSLQWQLIEGADAGLNIRPVAGGAAATESVRRTALVNKVVGLLQRFKDAEEGQVHHRAPQINTEQLGQQFELEPSAVEQFLLETEAFVRNPLSITHPEILNFVQTPTDSYYGARNYAALIKHIAEQGRAWATLAMDPAERRSAYVEQLVAEIVAGKDARMASPGASMAGPIEMQLDESRAFGLSPEEIKTLIEETGVFTMLSQERADGQTTYTVRFNATLEDFRERLGTVQRVGRQWAQAVRTPVAGGAKEDKDFERRTQGQAAQLAVTSSLAGPAINPAFKGALTELMAAAKRGQQPSSELYNPSDEWLTSHMRIFQDLPADEQARVLEEWRRVYKAAREVEAQGKVPETAGPEVVFRRPDGGLAFFSQYGVRRRPDLTKYFVDGFLKNRDAGAFEEAEQALFAKVLPYITRFMQAQVEAGTGILQTDREITDAPGRSFHARQLVFGTRFLQLPYMWRQLTFDMPEAARRGDPDILEVSIPNWLDDLGLPEDLKAEIRTSGLTQLVFKAPTMGLSLHLGFDYVGEHKMGPLTIAMFKARAAKSLAIQAALSVARVKTVTGERQHTALVTTGPSLHGKSTMTIMLKLAGSQLAQRMGLQEDTEEGVYPMNDDIVLLQRLADPIEVVRDGKLVTIPYGIDGTENNLYAVPFGVTHEDDPITWAALRGQPMENVPMRLEDGEADLTWNPVRNMRAIVNRKVLIQEKDAQRTLERITDGETSETVHVPMERMDRVFWQAVRRRNDLLPPLVRLTKERYIRVLMYGEAVQQGAAIGAIGSPYIEYFSDPFIIGLEDENANAMLDILTAMEEGGQPQEFYVFNTGGVGADANGAATGPQYAKIERDLTLMLQEALLRNAVTFEYDPVLNVDVAVAIVDATGKTVVDLRRWQDDASGQVRSWLPADIYGPVEYARRMDALRHRRYYGENQQDKAGILRYTKANKALLDFRDLPAPSSERELAWLVSFLWNLDWAYENLIEVQAHLGEGQAPAPNLLQQLRRHYVEGAAGGLELSTESRAVLPALGLGEVERRVAPGRMDVEAALNDLGFLHIVGNNGRYTPEPGHVLMIQRQGRGALIPATVTDTLADGDVLLLLSPEAIGLAGIEGLRSIGGGAQEAQELGSQVDNIQAVGSDLSVTTSSGLPPGFGVPEMATTTRSPVVSVAQGQGRVLYVGGKEQVNALRAALGGDADQGQLIAGIVDPKTAGPKTVASLFEAVLERAALADSETVAGIGARLPDPLARELNVREEELRMLMSGPQETDIEASTKGLIDTYRDALPSG